MLLLSMHECSSSVDTIRALSLCLYRSILYIFNINTPSFVKIKSTNIVQICNL